MRRNRNRAAQGRKASFGQATRLTPPRTGWGASARVGLRDHDFRLVI